MDTNIQKLEDRFIKIDKIGEGAYGVVYKVQDKQSKNVF